MFLTFLQAFLISHISLDAYANVQRAWATFEPSALSMQVRVLPLVSPVVWIFCTCTDVLLHFSSRIRAFYDAMCIYPLVQRACMASGLGSAICRSFGLPGKLGHCTVY